MAPTVAANSGPPVTTPWDHMDHMDHFARRGAITFDDAGFFDSVLVIAQRGDARLDDFVRKIKRGMWNLSLLSSYLKKISYWQSWLLTIVIIKIARRCISSMAIMLPYLVGGIPTTLKNYRVRQLGWWHSQYDGKNNPVMFQTTNQMSIVIPIINHY